MSKAKLGRLFVAALGFAGVMGMAQASDDMSKEAIAERIKPVGEVYLEGATAQVAAPTGPRSGEQVYNASCTACHGAGIMGAPKSQSDDWGPRVAKGMDVLLHNAVNGFNAMPPKGGCVDCSEDEIQAAIEFMTQS
ncbi:cytochrome c5 family protein [Gallaecimonas sp. GXIMD4217]|uniref:c-type cytochrome n=1 Tax=Gallaecimonas sp. GXIMD4217 TaxID=3131927 RepID=UPI00311AC69F